MDSLLNASCQISSALEEFGVWNLGPSLSPLRSGGSTGFHPGASPRLAGKRVGSAGRAQAQCSRAEPACTLVPAV